MVSATSNSPSWRQTYFHRGTTPFWAVHVTAIAGIVLTGWWWTGLAVSLAMYVVLMFFVTAGYHRYFAHRTYKVSRPVQFLLGLGCTLTAQKGPLWWASHHRLHHKESDTERDPHSPVFRSFWWSHVGWIVARDYEGTDMDRVKDLARYPELRWLNRWHLVAPFTLGAVAYFSGGLALLAWYLLGIVLTWHGTFTINSLAHVYGKRRYRTGDDSRNNWWLALITHGEGWHNNHHHYQSSCRQGFRWYELDLSYYVLRLLAACRVVREIREPPVHIVEDRPKATVKTVQELARSATLGAGPQAR